MLQSMTGFGKSTGTFENKKITVEIKSLNSKSLDVFLKLPNIYRQNEIDLRKLITAQLERGKVDCIITVEQLENYTSQKINKDVVKSYYKQLQEIKEDLNLGNEDVLNTLLRLPDVFSVQSEEFNSDEWDFILKISNQALDNLNDFRTREGNELKTEFENRIQKIFDAFNKIPQYEEVRIQTLKDRIENNLEEFMGNASIDKNRFEQELIYYIEKIDISEEKHRLENHLHFFIETLNSKTSQGKKLGFITQEIGREINTLGSKSYHSEMQKLVVEMKDELEKIKEQVLNTV